jgi:hypothetical protein
MTAAVSGPTPLPCQADPERWFDRAQQAHARAGCRGCPVRRWCAREALKSAASWGMWAGVWIDGRHEDAAAHLQAVATGTLERSATIAAVVIDNRLGHGQPTTSHRSPTPLHRSHGSVRASSVADVVLARSCGHCEVMADGCRYTYDRLMSRRAAPRPDEHSSPAAIFAACHSCADKVDGLTHRLAIKFGYMVDVGAHPTSVPFYWRQSRWVMLDRNGSLAELCAEPIAI